MLQWGVSENLWCMTLSQWILMVSLSLSRGLGTGPGNIRPWFYKTGKIASHSPQHCAIFTPVETRLLVVIVVAGEKNAVEFKAKFSWPSSTICVYNPWRLCCFPSHIWGYSETVGSASKWLKFHGWDTWPYLSTFQQERNPIFQMATSSDSLGCVKTMLFTRHHLQTLLVG